MMLVSFSFAFSSHDYGQDMTKSILYFEAQISECLLQQPESEVERVDSGLHDGKTSRVVMMREYYDAGDNVKLWPTYGDHCYNDIKEYSEV